MDVFRAAGLDPAAAVPLGGGLRSDAWRVGEVVLRVGSSGYEREHALLARLDHVRVPHPLGGSWEVPGWDGPAWSVTTLVPGDAMEPGDLRCADGLAEVLRAVHALGLVHGDLHEGNVLVGSGGVGVIDFGDAEPGPPQQDLAALAFFQGWALAERVRERLGLDRGDVDALARDFALGRLDTHPDDREHAEEFLRPLRT